MLEEQKKSWLLERIGCLEASQVIQKDRIQEYIIEVARYKAACSVLERCLELMITKEVRSEIKLKGPE